MIASHSKSFKLHSTTWFHVVLNHPLMQYFFYRASTDIQLWKGLWTCKSKHFFCLIFTAFRREKQLTKEHSSFFSGGNCFAMLARNSNKRKVKHQQHRKAVVCANLFALFSKYPILPFQLSMAVVIGTWTSLRPNKRCSHYYPGLLSIFYFLFKNRSGKWCGYVCVENSCLSRGNYFSGRGQLITSIDDSQEARTFIMYANSRALWYRYCLTLMPHVMPLKSDLKVPNPILLLLLRFILSLYFCISYQLSVLSRALRSLIYCTPPLRCSFFWPTNLEFACHCQIRRPRCLETLSSEQS